MKARGEARPTVDGAGFGDFNDAGTTDMMLRDTGDALPGRASLDGLRWS
jgi:hypothetical protein